MKKVINKIMNIFCKKEINIYQAVEEEKRYIEKYNKDNAIKVVEDYQRKLIIGLEEILSCDEDDEEKCIAEIVNRDFFSNIAWRTSTLCWRTYYSISKDRKYTYEKMLKKLYKRRYKVIKYIIITKNQLKEYEDKIGLRYKYE